MKIAECLIGYPIGKSILVILEEIQKNERILIEKITETLTSRLPGEYGKFLCFKTAKNHGYVSVCEAIALTVLEDYRNGHNEAKSPEYFPGKIIDIPKFQFGEIGVDITSEQELMETLPRIGKYLKIDIGLVRINDDFVKINVKNRWTD